MRHDHSEQQTAARQRIQDQLDSLAKLRGYTKFTLESPPAAASPTSFSEPQPEPHPTTLPRGLRRPRSGFEKTKRPPLPHPAVAKPQARQESFYEHESHRKATELLEPYRRALGAAYPTIHFIARWSIEHATENDPAPHLMTCYWTLEEALGICERTVRRHLVEADQPWSATVAHLIDLRHNYGSMLDGKDKFGQDKYKSVITSTVVRFFPKGRLSDRARVKRWGRRDLLADSDEGRTRPTRPDAQISEQKRYRRKNGLMSGYSSVKEQSVENNWLLVKLGQTVAERAGQAKNCGSLYADIGKNHVLDALRSDLHLALEQAQERGASITRTRTRWVDTAAKILAQRHHDDKPLPHHEHAKHTTYHDGFTDLWRMVLWTAVKAELYGGTARGWTLAQRMVTLAGEGRELGVSKPSAWAWVQVREEVTALKRDYGTGLAGVLEA